MGIIHKLLMKQHFLEMDDKKSKNNAFKSRILTMDGKIVDNIQYVTKSHNLMDIEMDITIENNQSNHDDGTNIKMLDIKRHLPEKHLIQLYKYLADKTRKHNQMHLRRAKNALKNYGENNVPKSHSILCAYKEEELHSLDNGIINKAMTELNDEVVENEREENAHIKRNARLYEMPLNIESHKEQQQLLYFQQPQQHQQDQNKRDILLKIRQQIFERKRLRSKLYHTTTQVWRPW